METKWSFCPECGCKHFWAKDYLGKGSRICSNCGQEWWTDVDYSITEERISNRYNFGV